jgi:hypothetical protein
MVVANTVLELSIPLPERAGANMSVEDIMTATPAIDRCQFCGLLSY